VSPTVPPEPLAIEVDYRLPAGPNAIRQAEAIAIGQTAGTWDSRHAHRSEELTRHLGEVVAMREQDGAALATVRFPEANVEGDVASLLTMIFGKYSMAGTAKVVGLRLPEGYGVVPRHGIVGIRRRLNVFDRPLVMAIFKPALGLSAADHGALFAELAGAGIDIVKDDEVMGDLASAPSVARLRACLPAIEAARRHGREVLYAVNATGRGARLFENARRLVAAGANALLFNALCYGFAALECLATDPAINVPIFVHPALAGALCAAPNHGLGYDVVLGTLASRAGADAVLYPAHYGSLPFDPEVEARIRDALRARGVFPVPSAGIHPGVVPHALADYGTEVILNAGTGIIDHPDGPAAGVAAFHEALSHARPGRRFDPALLPEGPLKRALAKWGTG
jgi:2,3-diketo-5-methylthiopentyl-1-phosphate enolase